EEKVYSLEFAVGSESLPFSVYRWEVEGMKFSYCVNVVVSNIDITHHAITLRLPVRGCQLSSVN
ncbi:MAG TPA: hypothetical protein VEY06_01345, partial [Flavisolibacter sp.]|nr:hypothetical protein [Flavisolibacter sp.]